MPRWSNFATLGAKIRIYYEYLYQIATELTIFMSENVVDVQKSIQNPYPKDERRVRDR